MGKPISFKEFQKSRTRMTRQQYEKECGNEVSAPNVYSYICFLHIEVHLLEEIGEMPTEFYYVVAGTDDLETHSLEEAEKFLYNIMKSELPERKKKEKIDSAKFPRGLESWLQTHYQIVEYMGYNQDKYENGERVFKGSPVIEELDGQDGKQEFAEALTTEFETIHKDTDFSVTETHYYDHLDVFLKEKCYPKKVYVVKAQKVIEYETVVKASSSEEARDIADNLSECDFEETIDSVFRKTDILG